MSALLPWPEETPTVPVWPDAGRAFGVSRSAAYAMAKTGVIPTIRCGRCLRVPTAELRRRLGLVTTSDAA
jgi:hypothetical protein